jgi:type VI secretion system secreted protein VgrG
VIALRPEEDRPAPVMAGTQRTALTWIAIQLVDEDGEPVAEASYEVTLPDGSVRTGKLGGDGRAEERGVQAGTCQVRFPELQDEAWEFLETKSG